MASLVLGFGHESTRINGVHPEVLAALQAAAFQQFSEGLGFFLSTGELEHGPIAVLWCHPAIPIQFLHEDSEPVQADEKLTQKFVELMSKPCGVVLG